MKVIIRTSIKPEGYSVECDDIVERVHEAVTWLVLKSGKSDIIRFNMDMVESILFLETVE